MKAYLIDEGILLAENDEEFEIYATVYDKKYGYYDQAQYYVMDAQKAMEDAKAYVKAGIENTYAIVSSTALADDAELVVEELPVNGEEYLLENIVYSVVKLNGEIVENFIEK